MSLRTRLLLAVGLVACIALVAADIATYSSLHSFLYNRVDQTLASEHPGGPGGFGGPGGVSPDVGEVPQNAPGTFVEFREANGTVEAKYPAYEPGGHSYSPALPAHIPASSATEGPGTQTYLTANSTTAGGPQFRVLVTTFPDGDQQILGLPLDATAATLHQLELIELLVTGAALIAAIALGMWLVRVGLQPLGDVEDTAEAIANGELNRRVPGEQNRTEVGRLARVLNVMLARIERAFAERDATEAALRHSEDQLRRFVADASHELRTPLAAVSAYAELYGRGAGEHPEDLARLMKGIEDESARMKRLVEDLLLLARLDEGLPLERESVELVGLAAQAIQVAATVGPGWPVELRAHEPVEVSGDKQRLRQVLDNLLANVRTHTPEGTSTVVEISRSGSNARLEVADSGPGLTSGEAALVFDRFYRADPSRTRSSGGSGLGLSIVGAIVGAHGGTVSATPASPHGVIVTTYLPLSVEESEREEPEVEGARG